MSDFRILKDNYLNQNIRIFVSFIYCSLFPRTTCDAFSQVWSVFLKPHSEDCDGDEQRSDSPIHTTWLEEVLDFYAEAKSSMENGGTGEWIGVVLDLLLEITASKHVSI